MKTNDENSVKSQIINFRIAEIHEAIARIKTQLSEIRKSDKSQPKLYAVATEIFNTERALERFEDQLATLSKLFA